MNKGIRIINYFIDLFIIIILNILLSVLIENQAINENILLIIVYFTYYFLFEYFNGQTVGKIITKTKVTDLNGFKPGYFKILIRKILRFSPLDMISYLFGLDGGIHDILSMTKLEYKHK